LATRAPGLRSKIVAILKIVLPLVAFGMLLGLFVHDPDSGGGDIVFTDADLEALGDGMRLSNPTFSGVTDDSERFRFSAALVVPDDAPPQRAAITDLSGSIAFASGQELEVIADAGEIDMTTRMLQLTGNVQIETSDGYRVDTEQLDIDLSSGRIAAADGAQGAGPLGQIDSGALAIEPTGSEDDRLFTFGGGVRVIYDPPVAER
jgi:lipopolysaccharide export system protein LptC